MRIPQPLHAILSLSLMLSGTYALLCPLSVLSNDAAAVTVTAGVQINEIPPNVTQITCCFKDSDSAQYNQTGCREANAMVPYTPSGGKSHDMVCNITVEDLNGYQDMADGWVNATWHNVNVAWNSPQDLDTLYLNSSCRNITGSGSGMSMGFECSISGIRYWADAGNWSLLVNLSDGTTNGMPGKGYFIMANITSIWESSAIDFGAMYPGANGSQYHPGTVGVNATTNNTGNTIIDVEVAASNDFMNCTIGAIPTSNIRYDITYLKPMDTAPPVGACGQLSTILGWGINCASLNIPDCSDTCPGLAYNTVKNTYWGINIPPYGVGGSCAQAITIIGVQANP
jgi:hypothetical protein